MDEKELKRYARSLGVDPATFSALRQRFQSTNPKFTGRPKGKLPRPEGMLSVKDARKKYGITVQMIHQWRERGLRCTKLGPMILFNEDELSRWIEREFQ